MDTVGRWKISKTVAMVDHAEEVDTCFYAAADVFKEIDDLVFEFNSPSYISGLQITARELEVVQCRRGSNPQSASHICS